VKYKNRRPKAYLYVHRDVVRGVIQFRF